MKLHGAMYTEEASKLGGYFIKSDNSSSVLKRGFEVVGQFRVQW